MSPARAGLRNLFNSCVCLLAASLTLDSVLGGYDAESRTGFRSPSWYIGLVAVALSVLFVPELLRAVKACRPLLLMFGAFTTGLVVLMVHIAAGTARAWPDAGVDRPYKSMVMAACFLVVGSEHVWRRRLLTSFAAGWATFITLALYMQTIGETQMYQQYQVARTTVLNMNPNVMSVIAATGVILCLERAASARSFAGRLLAVGVTLPGVVVFLFGSSRSALVSLGAGMAALVWLHFRHGGQGFGRRAFRVAATSAVALTALAWLVQSTPLVWELWEGLETRVTASAIGGERGGRDDLALATIEILSENPLGVGFGRTMDFLHSDPHNAYLKIAAEGGVVAIGFLVAAALAMVPHVRRAARTGGDNGVLAVFALLAVSALAGQALVESPFWLFFALVVSVPGAQPRRIGRAATLFAGRDVP